MTRTFILATSLLCAGVAGATPTSFSAATDYSANLADDAAMAQMDFLTSTMSFADAMRMITTVTLPDFEPATATSDPRPRTVVPALYAQEQKAKEAKANGTTFLPVLD